MFKSIMTLLRGRVHDAEQSFADRNALPILAQQIREAARGVEAARKAVALAMAQHKLEKENGEKLAAKRAALEARALAAIGQGQDDLAAEAAHSIAFLETELENSRKGQAEFESGIAKLKATLRTSEQRLTSLQQGEKLALARDRTQRLTDQVPGYDLATLDDAEATLERLQSRQQERELTRDALISLREKDSPAAIIEKLAKAGCGAPLDITGEDVLRRLRQQVKPADETL